MLEENILPDNLIIYLFGFGGTGKLTIARELQKRFPLIVVDNQFINTTVFSLIDTDGVTPLPSRVWEYVEQVRTVVLQVIRELAKPKRSFLFTNELIDEDPGDVELYQKITQLAHERGALLIPVRLLISVDELCRRVQSPTRKKLLKSIDPDQAAKNWESCTVLKPEGCFELDVTHLSATDAAKEIEIEVHRRVGCL